MTFAILFAYAFIANVALAVVPHEPVVVWYGAHAGVWSTAVVATAGTVAASWVDHRLFAAAISKAAERPDVARAVRPMLSLFRRAPFAVIAASGLTPFPFSPFKAMAFAARYPRFRYLVAVAAGRFPRYALLAWLGEVVTIPAWAFVVCFLALLTPSLRAFRWHRQSAK